MVARAGERGAERTDQKAEWSGGFGNSARELQRGSASLVGFGGSLSAVGPAKEDSLSRGIESSQSCAKGWAMEAYDATRGAALRTG